MIKTEKLSKSLVFLSVALFGFVLGFMVPFIQYKIEQKDALIDNLSQKPSPAVLGERISVKGEFELKPVDEGYALFYKNANNDTLLGYDLKINVISGDISSVSCVEGLSCLLASSEDKIVNAFAVSPVDNLVGLSNNMPILNLKSNSDQIVIEIKAGSEIGYALDKIDTIGQDVILSAKKSI